MSALRVLARDDPAQGAVRAVEDARRCGLEAPAGRRVVWNQVTVGEAPWPGLGRRRAALGRC
eukprot:1134127-Alexandrium_andersonii.AAC.1